MWHSRVRFHKIVFRRQGPAGVREAIMQSAPQPGRVNVHFDPQTKELTEGPPGVGGLALSDPDRDAFLAALDNPPTPNDAALRAARRYKAAKQGGTLH